MNEFTKDRPTAEQLVEKLDNELEMTICSDVVHGLDYEYKQLQQENQELKLELSSYRQAILNDKEMLGLKEQNQKYKEVINKAIKVNKQVIKDIKDFYRPTKDIIYSGDTIIDIAEQNLEVLKEANK